MGTRGGYMRRRVTVVLVGLVLCCLSLSGCTTEAGPCPVQPYADLSVMADFAEDDDAIFRFPMDDAEGGFAPDSATFCTASHGPVESRMYHAAEDYHLPAGTPVYAMADGRVSFSGRMGGYGWLVIIDHPDANIYSLYGHLSPSRWSIEKGPVSKGELIGYLGDDDENGGSEKEPLVEHLHLGVRAGQMREYPAMGEWRWQAGWIEPCPTDLGWLRPSEVISGQEIPEGGFTGPERPLIEAWGIELLFAVIYLVGAGVAMVFWIKRDKHPITFVPLVLILTAGGYLFSIKGSRLSYLMFVLAPICASVGIWYYLRRRRSSGGC